MQPTKDYRASHLERGASYDSYLASVPFDTYMADWERRHLVAIVGQLFPSGGPVRYLDFACGTGRVAAAVAPLCQSALGIDISSSMLSVARQKVPRVTFRQADLTTEDPDLGEFDLVTSFRFFGNAQDELREGALRAIVKRMAPAGYLIINSHRNPRSLASLFDRLTGGNAGNMDLHLGKLRAMLERHGLRIRKLRPIGAWMYRSKLLNAYRSDDPRAIANEQRFSRPWLAAISPDLIVVAQRS
ncbi:MAG: class I SAM-dependent methyltransferase [Burkholderiales bacterium]|nr:class I SAM-dependent methyltransferase [Burkholderiales bacterium]